MKPFNALLLTSLVLGACEKSNDLPQLHEEATALARWYAPQVDDMVKRGEALRGRNVPDNLPEIPDVLKLVGESGAKVGEMKAIVTPGPDGKSELEKQADQLEKDGKIDELRKLIDEDREKLEASWTIANDDLTRIEGWLWQYEQGHANAAPTPPPAPPQAAPSTTGEPPPAAGSAAPEAAGSAAK